MKERSESHKNWPRAQELAKQLLDQFSNNPLGQKKDFNDAFEQDNDILKQKQIAEKIVRFCPELLDREKNLGKNDPEEFEAKLKSIMPLLFQEPDESMAKAKADSCKQSDQEIEYRDTIYEFMLCIQEIISDLLPDGKEILSQMVEWEQKVKRQDKEMKDIRSLIPAFCTSLDQDIDDFDKRYPVPIFRAVSVQLLLQDAEKNPEQFPANLVNAAQELQDTFLYLLVSLDSANTKLKIEALTNFVTKSVAYRLVMDDFHDENLKSLKKQMGI